jgi:hypothetical protein
VRAETPRAELPPALDIKKVGRPSKYHASYCELVIELGSAGKSKAQISAAIGVSRNTLDVWAKENPEFQDAIKRAQELALAWWETCGQENLTRPGFNVGLYVFTMANRFRADYQRNAGAAEEPARQQPLQSQAVAHVLVQEDRLAPMFEKRFYGGLKTIEHQPTKSATGNGHGNGKDN